MLQTKNSVCIKGCFKGTLKCEGLVILSKSANIEGDIVADYVAINGKVTGNVTALKQLHIGETGVVHGDVKATSITVSNGGIFDGTCKMLLEHEATDHRSSLSLFENALGNGKALAAKGSKEPQGRINGFCQKGNVTLKIQRAPLRKG